MLGALPSEISMFPGNQPMYWYLVLLPIALLPWVVWPLVYSRLLHIKGRPPAIGLIFCLVWVVPALLVLSMLGPRQPQFLLPLLPAFALLVSFLLFNEELIDHGEKRFSMSLLFPTILFGLLLIAIPLAPAQPWIPQNLLAIPPAVGMGLLAFVLLVIGLPASGLGGRIIIITGGVLLALIPALPHLEFLPAMLWEIPVYVGIGVALFGVALTWIPVLTLDQRIVRNAVFSMAIVTALMGWYYAGDNNRDNIRRSAQFLASMEQRQVPVAHVGEYVGQYHYYGRLTRTITSVSPEILGAWVAQNPRGVVITYTNGWQPDLRRPGGALLHSAPFADTEIHIWKASSLAGA